MRGILTIAWGAQDGVRASRLFETLSVLAAAVLLTAATATTVLEQASLDADPARTGGDAAGRLAASLPGKEIVVGAFTGMPYTYPSKATIGKQGGATDFTIDPVHWYTDPFHNPIYYGARVARWFTGGRTGMMVDFIHSKAMARLERGSLVQRPDGRQAAAGPRAHLRYREQARVLARA